MLSDWLTVFAYVDAHPSVSQIEVVKHFRTLKTGALLFSQSTLSWKLHLGYNEHVRNYL